MLPQEAIDEIKLKAICNGCVQESFLSTEIKSKGAIQICSYCGKKRRVFTIESLSERIDQVFKEHYVTTPDEPDGYEYAMSNDDESDYSWERDGEPVIDVIEACAEIPPEAARDIQLVLEDKYFDYDAAKIGEDTEFSSDSYYKETSVDSRYWHEEWKQFEESLRSEARFFNQSAARSLASILDGLNSMRTRDGQPLIVDGGPGTSMDATYRARVFQSEKLLLDALRYPDKEIGPPPSAHARAGRMNAHGISVFYGSSDPMAALAEVRPPVGSQVVVARFNIVRSVRLLDLTALRKIALKGSLFDPTFGRRLGRTAFLRTLSERITMPVMPDDEAFSYLATQAIADFLATESSLQLDGIIFPSVQVAGNQSNVVLFHKSVQVAELDIPRGTTVTAYSDHHTEDGWETEYSVYEEVPDPAVEDSLRKPFPHVHTFVSPRDETLPPTLAIDLNSLKVHTVRAVSVETTEDVVRRSRHTGSSEPF